MNDEYALIAACLADPKDDTLRLVLADWYDENATEERQRARAEGIRLTCNDPNRPTNAKRQAGEPAWIKANAERLWPVWAEGRRLFKFCGPCLLTNQVLLRYPVPLRTRTAHTVTIARFRGGRGVIGAVDIPFSRAGAAAPRIVRDEPHARLRFDSLPTVVTNPDWRYPGTARSDIATVWLFSRPLELAGLLGVWDFLVGHTDEFKSNGAGWCKVFTTELHKDPKAAAETAINRALTRWARQKAGVPDFDPLPAPLPAEGLYAEPLVAPRKIV